MFLHYKFLRTDKWMFLKKAADRIELIKYKLKIFLSEEQIICSSILKKFSIFVANANTQYYSINNIQT